MRIPRLPVIVRCPFLTNLTIVAVLLLTSSSAWGQSGAAAVLQERVASATTQIDPTAVPRLIKDLQNPDESVRLRAAKELGKLGAAAQDAIQALQNALKDSDEDVRRVANSSLKAIQAAQPASPVQQLIRDLQNADESVRLRAAKELGKLGAAARDAVPMLQKLMQDPDEDVRRVAAASVTRILAAVAPAGSRPDLFMLSVGIDRYAPPINSLAGCVNDAEGMAGVFRRQAGKTFGRVEAQMLTDANATRAKIDAGLASLRAKGKAGDWYVILLSGHGGPKLNRWGFISHDGGDVTDAALLDLADQLAFDGKKVMIIIDACFAGQLRFAAHPILNKHADAKKGGIILMVSSMPSQVSSALQRYSAFARAVEEGLSGLADYDGDKTVTLKELRRFTYNRVYELCLDRRPLPGLSVAPQDSSIDASISISEMTPLTKAEISLPKSEFDGPGAPIPAQLVGVWNLGSYRLRLDATGVFRAAVSEGNRTVQQGDGVFKVTPKHVILYHKQGIDRLALSALTSEEFRFRFQGRDLVLRRDKVAIPANSIAGSTWSGAESLAEFGKLTFQFDSDGAAVMIDARSTVNGTWTQIGNQVTITFANCVYEGAIQGQTLAGKAHFTNNAGAWTFSVTRNPSSPARSPSPDSPLISSEKRGPVYVVPREARADEGTWVAPPSQASSHLGGRN